MIQEQIRIVFIEDYALVRVGITSYLESRPEFQVIAQAESAEEGLEIVLSHQPDIVLMDLGLPGMNGIEATRVIKSNNPEIKVIMLTSHEHEESVIASLGAGANAYCLKGISPDRLAEVINTVMDGAAWLDPIIANVALSVFSEVDYVPNITDNEQIISLGGREREVLRLLTLGKSNNEIAAALFVSVHTVKSQVSTILQKLAVNDRVQAAVKAITSGILSLDEIKEEKPIYSE